MSASSRADARRHPAKGDFNKVYASYFNPNRMPSRSVYGCNGLVLELECRAYVGEK